ncbi:hypothetical protein D3C71_1661840 [compost metagenome]
MRRVQIGASQFSGGDIAVHMQNGRDALIDVGLNFRDQIDHLELIHLVSRFIEKYIVWTQVRHWIVSRRISISPCLNLLYNRHNA